MKSRTGHSIRYADWRPGSITIWHYLQLFFRQMCSEQEVSQPAVNPPLEFPRSHQPPGSEISVATNRGWRIFLALRLQTGFRPFQGRKPNERNRLKNLPAPRDLFLGFVLLSFRSLVTITRLTFCDCVVSVVVSIHLFATPEDFLSPTSSGVCCDPFFAHWVFTPSWIHPH